MRSLVALMFLASVGTASTSARADETVLDGLRPAAPSGIETQEQGIQVQSRGTHVAAGVCFAPIGETLVANSDEASVPTFRRLHETLASSWTVDISAALRRTSWRGNAVFAFFDLGDPNAVDEQRYAAMYQTSILKGKELYAHAHLSPAGGFASGHTYRMRISQLINGTEVLLAESDLRLE